MEGEAAMTNDPVIVNIESTLDDIMHRIGEMSYPEDADLIKYEAKCMIRQGWFPDEIVSYLRCCEEVDKDIEEHVALERMAYIRQQVLNRLGVKEFRWVPLHVD